MGVLADRCGVRDARRPAGRSSVQSGARIGGSLDDVVAPDGSSFPTLDQYYRALDVVCEHKDVIERYVYAAVFDLTLPTLVRVY
jgi:hypothetical protein